MRFRVQVALMLVMGTTLQLRAAITQPDLSLTYDKPAEKWTEALPVGNGRIGAMVFGGTEDERLQINESTLWGGGPHDYVDPGAHTNLEEIRRLIFAGKVDEAEKLSETMMGQPKLLMPYQPFCDLRLHFPGHGQATDYRRQLDLNDAVAETAYNVGSAQFRRETFISYPDQVLVVRITAGEAGRLSFTASLDSPQPEISTLSTAGNMLQLSGQIQPRQNPARFLDRFLDPARHAICGGLESAATKEGPSAAKADGWKSPMQTRLRSSSATRQASGTTGTSVETHWGRHRNT